MLDETGDQYKKWAPQICFNICASKLCKLLNRKRKCMSFTVPIIWREPSDHSKNCHLCMTNPIGKGLPKKKKSNLCNIQTFHQLLAPDALESFSLELIYEEDSEYKKERIVDRNHVE